MSIANQNSVRYLVSMSYKSLLEEKAEFKDYKQKLFKLSIFVLCTNNAVKVLRYIFVCHRDLSSRYSLFSKSQFECIVKGEYLENSKRYQGPQCQ